MVESTSPHKCKHDLCDFLEGLLNLVGKPINGEAVEHELEKLEQQGSFKVLADAEKIAEVISNSSEKIEKRRWEMLEERRSECGHIKGLPPQTVCMSRYSSGIF